MDEKKQLFSAVDVEHLLYLCRTVLNGRIPDIEVIKKMNLKAVYHVAVFHSLTALAAQGLKSVGGEDPFWKREDTVSVMRAFERRYAISMQQQTMLALEYQRLSAYMEQEHIWHMPLKGSILKDDYPKLGLREMTDYDILFDTAYSKEIHDWFASRNYEIPLYEMGVHDVYRKAPVYHFEMHKALYGEGHDPIFCRYYENVREKLIPDCGKKYACHFSAEDFYLYLLSHAYKHYSGGGTGLRLLTDLYVFLGKHREQMDWDYVRRELTILNLTDFEKETRELAFAVLSEQNLTKLEALSIDQQKLLASLAYSGTYGTLENRVHNQVEKHGKWEYLRKRLFPPKSTLAYYLPACRKFAVLCPAAWCIRTFVVVFCKAHSTFRELHLIASEHSESEES